MSIESLMLDTNQNLDEDGAFFYVEYKDGSMTEISFRTAKMAKNAYNLYSKEPEDNAKGWGWDTKYQNPTIAQQIRAKKATRGFVPVNSYESVRFDSRAD